MKKTVFSLMALAALLASCNGNKTNSAAGAADSAAADTAATADSLVYEGTLPAADTDGIQYRVALANDTTMGYSLSETYLGEKPETMNYNGVAEKVEKNGKTYYKLAEGKDATANFLVVNDSTLRLVNAELQEAATELNYDIKLVK